jgi:hypothetical protein
MNGEQHDHDLEPEVDLAALNDDQRAGLACINCAGSDGTMRAILTPDNPQSTIVFVHVDTGTCVRHVARYVGDLYLRLADIAEYAVDALRDAADPNGR